MGRILFIRVSAATFDEKDVLKAWPMLYAAVWPDPGVEGADTPAKVVRKFLPAPGRGVLELVDALGDFVRFSDMPKEWRTALQPPAERLEELRARLDEALGDRDVQKAQTLTGAIEDALDEAEAIMRGWNR